MSTSGECPMRDWETDERLFWCQSEIERAWNDAWDDAPVHRLAAAHPELADELYDFFVCVVEGEDDLDRVGPECAEMDRKVQAMLERTTGRSRE
jgi:hypothetical protein